VIGWVVVSLHKTMVDSRTTTGTNLYYVGRRFGGVEEGVDKCWCKYFPHKEGVLAFRLF